MAVPYEERWKEEFEKIKADIKEPLEDCIVGIEHVGSTSVEGLSSKPVIDLDVIIENRGKFETVKYRLKSAGNRVFFMGKFLFS